MTFDYQKFVELNINLQTPVVITNSQDFKNIQINGYDHKSVNDVIIKIER